MGFHYSIPTSSLDPNDSSFYPFSCHFPTCSSLCSLSFTSKCHKWASWYHLYIYILGHQLQPGSSFPFSVAVASSAQLRESQHYPWFFLQLWFSQICCFYLLLTSLQPLLSVSRYWSDHHPA